VRKCRGDRAAGVEELRDPDDQAREEKQSFAEIVGFLPNRPIVVVHEEARIEPQTDGVVQSYQGQRSLESDELQQSGMAVRWVIAEWVGKGGRVQLTSFSRLLQARHERPNLLEHVRFARQENKVSSPW
jgi:hypothetical protein